MEKAALQVPGVSVCRVAGVDADNRPMVEMEGLEDPCPADVVWMKDAPDWSRCEGLRVLVAVREAEPEAPVILGLLDAPPETPSSPGRKKQKRLRIEGEEEVVIQCGKSKIALRADGRIEIRGGHLISRSTGPNKVKGATVHIN